VVALLLCQSAPFPNICGREKGQPHGLPLRFFLENVGIFPFPLPITGFLWSENWFSKPEKSSPLPGGRKNRLGKSSALPIFSCARLIFCSALPEKSFSLPIFSSSQL